MQLERSAQLADGPVAPSVSVRRPAHSGNAAVARFPRCARHGVAPAAGLTHNESAAACAHGWRGSERRSCWACTSTPPGPYQVPLANHQPY